MGASKRGQMLSFDEDWPDQIWSVVEAINGGAGAGWKLGLAAIAVTGCRPASLESGVTFSIGRAEDGRAFIQARIVGSKLTESRGQPEHTLRWFASGDSHRPKELAALIEAVMAAPERSLVVKYDAEGISTRLREISKSLWPRRRYAVTGYCYRHLLSSTAKAAGVDPEELAAAMGHRSAESAGRYARAGRAKRGGRRPFASAKGSMPVSMKRAPMARFKASTAIKKKMRRSI